MSSLNELFTDIADAIRSRNGTEDKILATDFPEEILNLEAVNGEEISVIPSTVKQVYTPSTGYNAITRVDVDAVTSSIDNNIAPENIKKDVTILGITGTLEEGAGSTTNGAKIFTSIDEMNADTDIKDGDMALVYASTFVDATVDSEFQTVRFPKTVVLPAAVADMIYTMFRSTSDVYFNAQVMLDSTSFRFDGWGDSSEVMINYTSTDGITYTRTDEGEEMVDLGTTVKCSYVEEWNDIFGYFIQVGGYAYRGLFQAESTTFSNLLSFIPLSNINRTNPNYTVNEPGYDYSTTIDVDKLFDAVKTGFNWGLTNQSYRAYAYAYWDTSSKLKVVVQNGSNNGVDIYPYDNGSTLIVGAFAYETTEYMRKYWVIDVNISDTGEYSVTGYNGYLTNYTSLSSRYYYTYPNIHASTVPVAFAYGYNGGLSKYPLKDGQYLNGILRIAYIESNTYKSVVIDGYMTGIYTVRMTYQPAPNQFTVTEGNQLLPGMIALGKNGEVVGTEDIYDNIQDQVLVDHYLKLPDDVPVYKYTGADKYLTFAKKGAATAAIVDTSERIVPEVTAVGTTTASTYSNGYRYYEVFTNDGSYYDAVIYRVSYDGTDVKSYTIQNVCASSTSPSSYCKLFAASDTHLYVWNNPRNTTTMNVINFSSFTPTMRTVTLPSTAYIAPIGTPSNDTMYFVLHSSSTAKLYRISGTSTSCTLIKTISSVYSSGYYAGAGKYAFVKMSAGEWNVYDCSTGSLLTTFTLDTSKYSEARIYMKQIGNKLYCYHMKYVNSKFSTFYLNTDTKVVTYVTYDKQGEFVKSNGVLYYVTANETYRVNTSDFSLTLYLTGDSKTLFNRTITTNSDMDAAIRNISETNGVVEVTYSGSKYVSDESRYILTFTDIKATKVTTGLPTEYDYMLWAHRDSEDAIILHDNTDTYKDTITPEEYSIAVDTAAEILGEEVNE